MRCASCQRSPGPATSECARRVAGSRPLFSKRSVIDRSYRSSRGPPQLSNFKAYEEFCSNHGAALAVISPISQRPEWDLYERQCTNNASDLRRRQYVESTTPTSPFLSPRTSFASLGTSTAGPSTLPTPAVPFDPQATLTRAKSYASTLSSPSSIQNQFAKLRYEDYAIKPVQMICRYQLILGQILKNWEGEGSEEFEDARRQVLLAWDGLRRVAIGVDEAKSRREGELRTKLVASRLDFHSVRCQSLRVRQADAEQSINSAFCAILGATLLCGSLHVLHHTPSPTGSTEGRLKYYGCFLYRSHLVMVKVKKRDSYLPREWVPLRLLSEIVGIPEGEGESDLRLMSKADGSQRSCRTRSDFRTPPRAISISPPRPRPRRSSGSQRFGMRNDKRARPGPRRRRAMDRCSLTTRASRPCSRLLPQGDQRRDDMGAAGAQARA